MKKNLIKNAKIFLVFLLIFNVNKTILNAQNTANCNYITDYYPDMYKAFYAYKVEKDIDKAYKMLTKLKNKCELIRTPAYNEIELYLRLAMEKKDYKNAAGVCRKLVKDYAFPWDEVPLKMDGKKLIDSIEYAVLHKQSLQQQDTTLVNLLKLMIDEDLQVRHFFYRKVPVTNEDSIKNANDLVKKSDSINNIRLKYIFQKWGCPSVALTGGRIPLSSTIDIMLIHLSHLDTNYYHNTIAKFVQEGKCPPYYLGLMVDRWNYKNFIYNTTGTVYDKDGNVIKTPPDLIFDYPNLDKRRVSIGLPPSEMYEKMWPRTTKWD